MKRAVKRDSMYSLSRSIVNKKDENPFWDGQTGMEFIQQAHEGKIFNGKYSDLDLVLAKVKDNTMDNYGTINDEYSGFKNLYLSADDVNHCVEQGWLNKRQISNLGDIVSSIELKNYVKRKKSFQKLNKNHGSKDIKNGRNRFKSGFFVDPFTNSSRTNGRLSKILLRIFCIIMPLFSLPEFL